MSGSGNGTPGFSAVPQHPQHGNPFLVELPAGGNLYLHSHEEVDLWEKTAASYKKEYQLVRINDLVLLGSILTQALALFRAQQKLNGMEPEFDAKGQATGRYKKVQIKPAEVNACNDTIRRASAELREGEKALGIDKRTREAGGQESVRDYLTGLKRFANQYGVHISKRVMAYENFCMELRVKLRMEQNLDDEDKRYEKVFPDDICEWARGELAKIEEVDRKFANEKGRLFIGRKS